MDVDGLSFFNLRLGVSLHVCLSARPNTVHCVLFFDNHLQSATWMFCSCMFIGTSKDRALRNLVLIRSWQLLGSFDFFWCSEVLMCRVSSLA